MVAGLGPSDRSVVLDDNAAAVVVADDDDDGDNSQFGSFSCRLEAPSVVNTPVDGNRNKRKWFRDMDQGRSQKTSERG